MCKESDVLTPAKRSWLLESLLPFCTQWATNALSVVPSTEAITAPGSMCGPSTPARGPYKAADMVLIVTARPTKAAVLAYAAACVFDAATNRPVMGYMNFGPGSLETACGKADAGCTTASLLRSQGVVGAHELTHALGFSASLFKTYLDPSTGAKYAKPITATATRGSLGTSLVHATTQVVTPAVVAAARAHFGCATLDGLELEDQGGSGTAGSHWEKRLAFTEYMSGTADDAAAMTNLTLALLHDTGWYRVNFTAAEAMAWGAGLGCTFAQARCNMWSSLSGFDGYFCDAAGSSGCSHDRRAKAGCSIVKYPEGTLSGQPWYQFFASAPDSAGPEPLADYCPLFVAYSDGSCLVPANADQSARPRGEQFAADSRCFMSTLMASNVSSSASAETLPACYRTLCASPTDLRVKIGRLWWKCPAAGGPVDPEGGFEGFLGRVYCPPAADLCARNSIRAQWPELSDVSPNVVPLEGGTDLTLFGKHFSRFGSVVLVNDVPCDDVIAESAATLFCTAPTFEPAALEAQLAPDSTTVPVRISVFDSQGRSTSSVRLLSVQLSSAVGMGPFMGVVACFSCFFLLATALL